ncbi:hypothetical protein HMPREF9477_01872 [Lachnospiraceae bacterium 2_1_46FAA]|nr:hypothetical protein HMPREF9477_01872 [Lachnospiraceae bacterium 2_1_46FAA]
MKLVIVLLTHIDNLPPARNLLISLSKIEIKVELITMYSAALPEQIRKAGNITIHDVQSEIANNKLQALKNRFKRRRKVRTLIKEIMSDRDVLWTVTDYDAMEVGDILNNYRHVMQLMELIQDIPIFDELPFYKANLQKYAQTAEMVIVPEYNRAYIQQAYWQLKNTPKVLPNKPTVYKQEYDIEAISPKGAEVLSEIGNRKIVLYQGVFGYERVLDQFIEAVEQLGDDYCMLLMGRDDEELQKLLEKYPETFFVPFIAAPNHLAITSKAHIGVLSYVNTNNIRHYDPLNALYCAPNKLYEYACFGIPMIGNDIPGLRIPFEQNNIGRCSELKANEIAEAIRKIEMDYSQMSKNCIQFYESIDMDKLVGELVKDLISKE